MWVMPSQKSWRAHPAIAGCPSQAQPQPQHKVLTAAGFPPSTACRCLRKGVTEEGLPPAHALLAPWDVVHNVREPSVQLCPPNYNAQQHQGEPWHQQDTAQQVAGWAAPQRPEAAGAPTVAAAAPVKPLAAQLRAPAAEWEVGRTTQRLVGVLGLRTPGPHRAQQAAAGNPSSRPCCRVSATGCYKRASRDAANMKNDTNMCGGTRMQPWRPCCWQSKACCGRWSLAPTKGEFE